MLSAVILRIFVIATTSSRSVTGNAGRGISGAGTGRGAGAAAGAAAPPAATLAGRFSMKERMSFFVTRLWIPVPSISRMSTAFS
jgi:hypothetical protein